MPPRITLLGPPIDAVTRAETLGILRGFLEGSETKHVMTPNNEMLVEASKNAVFREILQKSDLNLPDSTGLLYAARWTGQKLPERVTGVDTVQELCRTLDEHHPIFLLGACEGVAERAANALQKQNPRLKVTGTFSGSPRPEDFPDILRRIQQSQPSILFVAFGAPAQDLWIAQHLQEFSSVRIAMGVGGTLDFLAGTQTRAPAWMRSVGLEWLWRFIREPSRWRRMWRAVVVFPWLVMTEKAPSR